MAGIEDALRFLDPKYIDKAKEVLSDPMGSGEGIMNAIKDLDPIEAADFVKDQVIDAALGESNIDLRTPPIVGEDKLSEVISQVGDYALDQAGIPFDMSTISDVRSAYTDEGAGGVVDVAKDIVKNKAVDLIKGGFVSEGLALATKNNIPVATVLALAKNPYTGPIVRDIGAAGANMGYDMLGMVPYIGDPLATVYDKGLNLLGINRQKDEPDPPVVIPPEVVSDVVTGGTVGGGWTPPATTNEAEVAYGGQQVDPGGGGGGSYGGGEDFGSPFAPSPPRGPDLTNRAEGGIIQKYNHGGLHKNPHIDDIDLSGSIPENLKDELMKYLLHKYMEEYKHMNRRKEDKYNQPPPTTLEAAEGGLATIPRYLKGR